MIDSINPRNLLDFALDVANWGATRPESFDNELDEVLRVIKTFCDNSEDPIYHVVFMICDVLIENVKSIRTHVEEEPEENEPIEESEPEVVNNGNSTGL